MQTKITFGIGSTDATMTVDTGAYPENVQDFILAYGTKRIFNDRFSAVSLESYREYEGNSNKSKAEFTAFKVELLKNLADDFLKGFTGKSRASSGGGLYAEVRAIVAANSDKFFHSAKELKGIRNEADLLVLCEVWMKYKLDQSGQKYVAKNLEYGRQTMCDRILAKAQTQLDSRMDDDLDVDINEVK